MLTKQKKNILLVKEDGEMINKINKYINNNTVFYTFIMFS